MPMAMETLCVLHQSCFVFPFAQNVQARTILSCNGELRRLASTAQNKRRNRRIRCISSLDQATTSSSASPSPSSWIEDSVDRSSVRLVLDVGKAVIPHPEKVEKGGEDAFFVSSFNGGVLGIADGVSGWAEENVDPALFSRELMEHALSAVGNEEVGNCPRQLLAKAHESTTAIGAATAILSILENNAGILHVANLGDCGMRLLRKGEIVFSTSTQQHYFDCPYQLSSEPGAQTANDAMVYKEQVFTGDIIIMGSDGLFDNLFDKDIAQTVQNLSGAGIDVQKLATELASLANKNSRDEKNESPYSQEAILQGYDLPIWRRILGQKLTGGKLDDITVLTACVVDAPYVDDDKLPTSIQEDPPLNKSGTSGSVSPAMDS